MASSEPDEAITKVHLVVSLVRDSSLEELEFRMTLKERETHGN